MATGVRACDDRCVATTSTSHARGGPPPSAATVDAVQQRKFYRRSDGRLVGGVAAGLASHLGLQPLTVRVSFALLASWASRG